MKKAYFKTKTALKRTMPIVELLSGQLKKDFPPFRFPQQKVDIWNFNFDI